MPQKKRQGPVLAAVEWSRGQEGKEQSEGGRSARRGAHRSPMTGGEMKKKGRSDDGERGCGRLAVSERGNGLRVAGRAAEDEHGSSRPPFPSPI
uniref:Uncharacterized protein n=1 Tax=Oryza glumipatula TaxID=40148 RepID=A0A0D9YPQ2_9ORYZ